MIVSYLSPHLSPYSPHSSRKKKSSQWSRRCPTWIILISSRISNCCRLLNHQHHRPHRSCLPRHSTPTTLRRQLKPSSFQLSTPTLLQVAISLSPRSFNPLFKRHPPKQPRWKQLHSPWIPAPTQPSRLWKILLRVPLRRRARGLRRRPVRQSRLMRRLTLTNLNSTNLSRDLSLITRGNLPNPSFPVTKDKQHHRQQQHRVLNLTSKPLR